MGGWIVSILVAMFATSVVVAYAFNARVCWDFLFAGRLQWLFPIIYVACAGAGTVMGAFIVWDINSISTAGLFAVNAIGLLWFATLIKSGVNSYQKKHA